MQRSALRSLHRGLHAPPALSWRLQQQRQRFISTAPPPPPQGAQPKSKRTIVCTVAFLAGLSFYFVLPDPSKHAPTIEHGPLSPKYFTPSTVTANDPSGTDTKLLTLSLPREVVAASDPAGFKAIWSVFIKDDDIQVERPYTPLEGVTEDGEMKLWIKKYPRGEVGRWLHSKREGDTIELRGPLKTWEWKEGAWDEVVMVSGGTGFTPFYQLFHSVVSDPAVSPNTRFTLLHSSKTVDDHPPSELVNRMLDFAEEHPERLSVELFVDVAGSPSETGDEKRIKSPSTVSRINESHIKRALKEEKASVSWWRRPFQSRQPEVPPKRRMFLVCGPEPMIAAIAGPYGRNMSQGAVGGALKKLGFTEKDVYKL